jgi:hypothetical protein
VKKRTTLLRTWSDGPFAVTGDGRRQRIADLSVRGLAADRRGGALVIVGGNSLRRHAPNGDWAIIATSEFELSCCAAVRDVV